MIQIVALVRSTWLKVQLLSLALVVLTLAQPGRQRSRKEGPLLQPLDLGTPRAYWCACIENTYHALQPCGFLQGLKWSPNTTFLHSTRSQSREDAQEVHIDLSQTLNDGLQNRTQQVIRPTIEGLE